ncbi:hypothetical protein WJX81_000735 [Elliptochloris bilobata]|uniref:Golgi apparatus membrane protein TVP23 n=1 Tax=Elliptochloris bilobata TaxID=381761 RepID=A0AAW1RDQ5_9CHLO
MRRPCAPVIAWHQVVGCRLGADLIDRIVEKSDPSYRPATIIYYKTNLKRLLVRFVNHYNHNSNGRPRKVPLTTSFASEEGLAVLVRFMAECMGNSFPGQKSKRVLSYSMLMGMRHAAVVRLPEHAPYKAEFKTMLKTVAEKGARAGGQLDPPAREPLTEIEPCRARNQLQPSRFSGEQAGAVARALALPALGLAGDLGGAAAAASAAAGAASAPAAAVVPAACRKAGRQAGAAAPALAPLGQGMAGDLAAAAAASVAARTARALAAAGEPGRWLLSGKETCQASMPDEQVAYGHPWVVAFTLLFKIASVVVYMICGLLSSSFITNFVVVTILLMLDFWTTKNVAGRLLVGLRYWNEVTDEGSNWRFETLEAGQRAINGKDKAVFWWSLWTLPILWLLMGVVALVKLKVDYLLVVVVALVLSGANVVGYTKCSKEASQQLRNLAAQAVSSGFTAAMSRV